MTDKVNVIMTPSVDLDGVSRVYQEFMQDVAGLYEVPVAMLLGRASDGGEDVRAYYDHVERQISECLFEPFERALENIKVLAMRRRLYASRRLKPGRHRGRRVKE